MSHQRTSTRTHLDLTGLTTGPAQVWGGIRLVPLLRAEPVTDLRLHQELYEGEYGYIETRSNTVFTSYIPHGFVAHWTGDGSAAAAYGTQLGTDAPARMRLPRSDRPTRLAKRSGADRLRFLPLNLALEGYLSLHFGGPTIAWEHWSAQALRRGLSPREEEAYSGAAVRGLADALRVFEIHPGQCGVLLYTADALAAAFVVPHPDDYRALHRSLLLDLYGELVHHYALLSGPVPDFRADLRGSAVRSLADLRTAAARAERDWAAFHDTAMAGDLLTPEYRSQTVRRMGRFTLARFLPDFRPKQDNHIGETITDPDGRVLYLKTFRLSESQVRRSHLLDRLAAHDWHLPKTAAALGLTEPALALRLENAGFAHLLRQDILDRYRKANRS